MAHARSQRVARGVQGSTDQQQHCRVRCVSWQIGSELARFVPHFISGLHLAGYRCMHVGPCGSAYLRRCIVKSGQFRRGGECIRSKAIRVRWRTLAPNRLPEVCKGARTSNSTPACDVFRGRLAVGLLGSSRGLFSCCIWPVIAASVCDLAFQHICADVY